MPINTDTIDYCAMPDQCTYVHTRPEDWWKHIDTIDYAEPSPPTGEDSQAKLKKEFSRLAKLWKTQTAASPSVAGMVMHPAYLEIISHGEQMIPFILKDLENKPSHWFIALRILAKTSPVKPEDAGNIKKMTESWLAWGKEKYGKLD